MSTRIAAAIAASFALFGGIFALAGPAMAYPPEMGGAGNATDTMTSGLMGGDMRGWHNDTGKTFSIISSIQNDESGEPAWLVAGHLMMTNDTGASNETGSTNVTDLYAGFHMVMLDGSAAHSHEVYNFTQEGDSVTSGNMTTITGTSTVTMREGPVEDVATEITISQGSVVAISFDPAQIENHFGDTPVYGLVITPEILRHMMDTTTGSTMMGNVSGMHEYKWNGNTTTAMTEETWE